MPLGHGVGDTGNETLHETPHGISLWSGLFNEGPLCNLGVAFKINLMSSVVEQYSARTELIGVCFERVVMNQGYMNYQSTVSTVANFSKRLQISIIQSSDPVLEVFFKVLYDQNDR